MIDGLRRIPLKRFDDERGWFVELMRASELPKPVRQSNLSYSREGVIRGLHYHERGQDDLFACMQGTARVVVLEYHPPGCPEADTHAAARRLLEGHGYEFIPLFEHPGGVGMAWAFRAG